MFHFPTIQTSFGLRINENLFEAHLLTKCAYSECEPQGGEIASAELDGQYKRLRRVVAKLAHKAQWHNNGTILIYASAECVPTRSGRRGFPFKGERRLGKHVRKGEIAFRVSNTHALRAYHSVEHAFNVLHTSPCSLPTRPPIWTTGRDRFPRVAKIP